MEISTNLILWGFSLTLFAGVATSIGAFLAFFVKKENYNFLSFWLWLSAWVMIYISLVEIIPKSIKFFELSWQNELSNFWMIISLWFWMLFALLIDIYLPEELNPDEPKESNMLEENKKGFGNNKKLYRAWLLTAFVIAIHNIPEGLITFLSTLVSFEIWIAIAIALALHKIPEGFAIALPIYYSTGNKIKAFILTSLSWMANILGALIGFIFLQYFVSDLILWILFSLIAWIMLFVSFHQLLPTASQYNKQHIEVYWVLIWMILTWLIMSFLAYL